MDKKSEILCIECNKPLFDADAEILMSSAPEVLKDYRRNTLIAAGLSPCLTPDCDGFYGEETINFKKC